jgi:hypothetical protein
MKKTGLLLIGILLAVGGGLFVWQQRVVSQLQNENQALRRLVNELQTLREENARLAKERVDPAELERLRAGQSELIRLRGQVAQLRRQVADAASKRPAPGPETPTAAAVDASAPPVDTFTATAQAVVPWKQTLVTGGWTLPSGKRALVFIQPHPVEGDQAGQIELQTRIVEMPDAVLSQAEHHLRVAQRRADGRNHQSAGANRGCGRSRRAEDHHRRRPTGAGESGGREDSALGRAIRARSHG